MQECLQNIEAQQKIRSSYKKKCVLTSLQNIQCPYIIIKDLYLISYNNNRKKNFFTQKNDKKYKGEHYL